MPRTLPSGYDKDWMALEAAAWKAQSEAYILGKTKVGAAALAQDGATFSGCNIEHKFRSHDIHAEVGAISSLVAAGHRSMVAILIVAERERFTPCGACMDWIFQIGGEDCMVGFQRHAGDQVIVYSASELMPYYPIGHGSQK